MMAGHVVVENDCEAAAKRRDREMRQAFKVFDIDGDGLIDAQELKLTMRNLGENLTDEDIGAMIRAADRNHDGKIDFDGTSTRCFVVLFGTVGVGWREAASLRYCRR